MSSGPQKVLIITGIYPPDIGGPASYTKTLAQKLSEDFQTTIITYSSVRKYPSDSQAGYKVFRVWKKTPWFWKFFIYAWKVFWETRRHDLILVFSVVNGGIPALLASRLFQKKMFVKVVGDSSWQTAMETGRTFLLIDDWQKAKKTGRAAWLWYWQSLVVRKADRVIVPSRYLSKMVQGWGVSPEKIEEIYNGTDFKPNNSGKEEARKKIGIAGNIIVSVGRLAPWKGFKMLIKIMPKLLQINQFFRLVIIGSGPEEKYLQAMVKNLGLEKKVYLTGSKTHEELAIFLAAADIFVLNTGYEGFSHQILEAMKADLPVITTAVGGNKEIIHQGENGFMVKYNDEFNLIEAIKTVWNISELRGRFIANGKKTVEYFSVEKMLEKTINLISKELNYV